MGDVKVESFLRVLFALGLMSVQQLSVTGKLSLAVILTLLKCSKSR